MCLNDLAVSSVRFTMVSSKKIKKVETGTRDKCKIDLFCVPLSASYSLLVNPMTSNQLAFHTF